MLHFALRTPFPHAKYMQKLPLRDHQHALLEKSLAVDLILDYTCNKLQAFVRTQASHAANLIVSVIIYTISDLESTTQHINSCIIPENRIKIGFFLFSLPSISETISI